jgi:hypothetical protein
MSLVRDKIERTTIEQVNNAVNGAYRIQITIWRFISVIVGIGAGIFVFLLLRPYNNGVTTLGFALVAWFGVTLVLLIFDPVHPPEDIDDLH